MSLRVDVDRDVCIGAGNCVLTVETVFDQDPEDGRVRLLIGTAPPGGEELVRRAAYLCPSGAITILE